MINILQTISEFIKQRLINYLKVNYIKLLKRKRKTWAAGNAKPETLVLMIFHKLYLCGESILASPSNVDNNLSPFIWLPKARDNDLSVSQTKTLF